MLTKKIFYISIVLTILALTSCGPKIEIKNIFGTWTKINDPEVDDPGVTEQISFDKDGKYRVTQSNKDSVINSFEGTFELNVDESFVIMTNEGWRLKDMEIMKLTATEMSAKVSEEGEGRYVLNYRRQ